MRNISASLMCADLLNLGSDISRLESLGVNYLHLDFMDGNFVSNITFGTSFIRACRRAVKSMELDVHIMGYKPEQYFEKMEIGASDIVSFHYEASENRREVIKLLRDRNASVLMALSPDTPVCVLEEYAEEIDGALIMTVYPGDSGRQIVPGSFEKIAAARELFDRLGLKDRIIEVDGNVSWMNIPYMKSAGADLFVAGTSSIFQKGSVLEETVPKFLSMLN